MLATNRVREQNVPTVDQLRESLEKARSDLTVAERRHANERGRYVSELGVPGGDEISHAKSRKKLDEVAAAVEVARDRIAVLEALLERASEQSAAEEAALRVKAAHELGQRYVVAVANYELRLKSLPEEHDAVLKLGLEFRAALPKPPPGVEEASLLYSPPRFSAYVQQWLYALSGGRLGRGATTKWEILQGPTLEARARETVQRAMSFQPKPPPAAAIEEVTPPKESRHE